MIKFFTPIFSINSMEVADSFRPAKKGRFTLSFIGISAFFLLCSFHVMGQTAPGDTSHTIDRGVMGNCAGTSAPVASTNPVCAGTTTNLSLSAGLDGFASAYQWQVSTVSAVAGFANVAGGSGGTTNAYTTPALVFGTSYWYRCQVSSCCGACTTTNTTVLAVTVIAGPTTSAAGGDQGVCATTATLAGNSPAAGETAVWTRVSGSGTITTPTSATSGLTALGAGPNTFTWTITKTANGCTSSDDVIINNNNLSTYLAYASTNCPASTTSADLSLAANLPSGATIKWQQNDNSAGFADIAGGTTNPYTTAKTAGHTYAYRALITTACATYTITAAAAVTNYSMFDYGGGMDDYTTANGEGGCYTGLVGGQKYCFAFTYSNDMEANFVTDCASCPALWAEYSAGTTGSGSSVNGSGCASVSSSVAGNCSTTTETTCANCSINMYDASCTLVKANGWKFGSGCSAPALTVNAVYYICVTLPVGCATVSVCPEINCLNSNCHATPLPIDLLYFSATAVDKNVQLKWATSTETNNDYFTLERSKDGLNFEELERVKGAGNSTSMLEYNSVDEHPYEGISYYRLKQTDYDGKFVYSQLAWVNMNPDSPLELIYVNPDQNKNTLQYQFRYDYTKPLFVEVLDVVGKTVYSQKNSFENSGQPLTIDASGLSKGVYLLKISDGIYSEMKKFIY